MMVPTGMAIAIQQDHRRRIERINRESWKYQPVVGGARRRLRAALLSNVYGK